MLRSSCWNCYVDNHPCPDLCGLYLSRGLETETKFCCWANHLCCWQLQYISVLQFDFYDDNNDTNSHINNDTSHPNLRGIYLSRGLETETETCCCANHLCCGWVQYISVLHQNRLVDNNNDAMPDQNVYNYTSSNLRRVLVPFWHKA